MDRRAIPSFRRGFRLQWEAVQNCHVVLYPEGMVKLNDSAAAVLLLVYGERRISDIIDQLAARFPAAQAIGTDIDEFMQRAYEQKWILFSD
ncbi:pyrroloquinoline quinone biosynthesis peptide chaperone PqqD [Candidatus Sodalis endolongispinus]|uniref:PqqA binding protein n=1 Tax=Candidatus Sodalis endolongispinus TaxID=2812662 RepID=A0ABS5YEW3_9GAMM|nr:pyrroloquinoline quinone biosynthesis peptide chaperone PqqD [Candidatus Sodalis endolongispinus]MBT9433262.1 pyrroloquinoline quinone biosynthesis peptide chaperone PqqD [Candidatus Sodalis endolongispinus]